MLAILRKLAISLCQSCYGCRITCFHCRPSIVALVPLQCLLSRVISPIHVLHLMLTSQAVLIGGNIAHAPPVRTQVSHYTMMKDWPQN